MAKSDCAKIGPKCAGWPGRVEGGIFCVQCNGRLLLQRAAVGNSVRRLLASASGTGAERLGPALCGPSDLRLSVADCGLSAQMAAGAPAR